MAAIKAEEEGTVDKAVDISSTISIKAKGRHTARVVVVRDGEVAEATDEDSLIREDAEEEATRTQAIRIRDIRTDVIKV
jgi:hypothetical protein